MLERQKVRQAREQKVEGLTLPLILTTLGILILSTLSLRAYSKSITLDIKDL